MALKSVQSNGEAYQFLDKYLKEEYDLKKEALKNKGIAITFMDEIDEELVKLAIK